MSEINITYFLLQTLQFAILKVCRKYGISNQVNMDNFKSTVILNIKKEKTVNLKKILLT